MRLTALFWWIDRWRKSSAYMDMTLEEQGAYRNLLDEAHLRGGPLPNDERILAKACGDALAWPRVQIAVMSRFELRSDGWHNLTLDQILSESVRRAQRQADYRARKDHSTNNRDDNGRYNKPDNSTASPSPSPSPSPSLISGTVSESKISDTKNKLVGKNGADTTAHLPASARSKRPIFTGQRLTVFEWMLDDCVKTLGPLTETFDLHAWFFDLDEKAAKAAMVIPKRDGGAWLQAQLLAEAERRGLPLAVAGDNTVSEQGKKNIASMHRAIARIQGKPQ